MPADVLVALIVFLAIFVQAASGFGLGLVSMPLLTAVIGLSIAAPMMSIVGMLAEFVILLRFRTAVNIRAVSGLVIAALVGTPVGLWLLGVIDPAVGARVLGLVVAGYALYGLFSPHMPTLAHPVWAYGFGFAAGLLGGLFNTSGPPVIIYGNCRRWPPNVFKGNLQGFFLPTGIVVLAGHVVEGNVTAVVGHYVLIAIPAVLLGLVVGFALDGRVPAPLFRKIILILLLAIGLRLLIA